MEFCGGLQTQKDITDNHISDSDLVAFSTDKVSVGTDLMHQHMLQTFISYVAVMSSFVSNILQGISWLLFPNYTVQKHIVPKCSNKSPVVKCAEIRIGLAC